MQKESCFKGFKVCEVFRRGNFVLMTQRNSSPKRGRKEEKKRRVPGKRGVGWTWEAQHGGVRSLWGEVSIRKKRGALEAGGNDGGK